MSYVPTNARWYVAELVLEFIVEGDDRNVVHRNLVLVRAESPGSAYDKAVAQGKQSETSYLNPNRNRVSIKFRGIAKLNVIYDELEDGAELLYTEHIGVASEEIEHWIARKEDLSVFCPIRKTSGPDYSSKDVLDEVAKLIEVAETDDHE